MEQYLECARVTTTHGVRGAVRLECRMDSPAKLAALKTMYKKNKDGSMTALRVTHAAPQKGMVIASFAEIATMEDAIALRDAVLFADRADIPLARGSFFIADLIGLPVVDDESGQELGVLEEVISPAGQDIYVVRRGEGTFMIPAVPAFIRSVTVQGEDAAIRVALIEGMIEE